MLSPIKKGQKVHNGLEHENGRISELDPEPVWSPKMMVYEVFERSPSASGWIPIKDRVDPCDFAYQKSRVACEAFTEVF
jgi:hypothetical protein